MPFITKVKVSSTIIAAAALISKPGCGLDVQLKIWMVSTVNSSIGLVGAKGTYTKAPITIRGAVSPIALDIARMRPVRILPNEEGSTTRQIVCHLLAPNP